MMKYVVCPHGKNPYSYKIIEAHNEVDAGLKYADADYAASPFVSADIDVYKEDDLSVIVASYRIEPEQEVTMNIYELTNGVKK